MKFIAKLKSEKIRGATRSVHRPKSIMKIGKPSGFSYVELSVFDNVGIVNPLYEWLDPLYFLHDMLDTDWTWMNELPEQGKSFWSEINYCDPRALNNCDNRKTTRDISEEPSILGEFDEIYFVLSSNGDKLVFRLELTLFEYSDDDQHMLMMGYSGSQKQLQEYMRQLGITSNAVKQVYLNEFSTRRGPWVKDYYDYIQESMDFQQGMKD